MSPNAVCLVPRHLEDVPKFVEFEVEAPGSVVVKRSCERIEGAVDVSLSRQGLQWKSQQEGGRNENTNLPLGGAMPGGDTPEGQRRAAYAVRRGRAQHARDDL